ncbi:MAG TPA: hypothetical protein VFI83_07555 [Gaiella sp.]|nr:hypothetical protein [Gaiella sp.]
MAAHDTVTGEGVRVGVIDGGIDVSHPDLAGAIDVGASCSLVVGLKACTFAGYCFVDSVAAALRYAGDQRLDVVNLSLFADPYLYYCANEAGQRAIFQDLQAAARYAQQRGGVIVAAAGNEAFDPGIRRRIGSAPTGRPTRPRSGTSATTAVSRRLRSQAW